MERGIFVPMMIPAFPDNPCSGGGTGTVTSVALTAPAIFAVANSPVTTAGSLDITLVNQSPNLVFASPTTAPAAPPTFRTLVAADLGTGTATVNTVLRGDMTWGNAPIVGWTPSLNTSSPNNTVNASRLLVNSTSANGDAVIQPKGTGAFLGNLPDDLASGGSKRGIYAVDLQLSRGSATQVAAGQYSAILSGSSNRAGGNYAIIVGGASNTASGDYSYVLGGSSNTAAANASYVLSGSDNYSGTQYSTTWGIGARTFSLLQRSFGSYSSTNGTKQVEEHVLYRATTPAVNGNTAIEITVDGLSPSSTNQVLIQNNSTYTFWGVVTGVGADTSGGTQYNYCAEFKGVIRRINASTIAILGCPTVAVIADDSSGKLIFDLQVDTVNNALRLIGQNNVSINAYGQWMVYIKLIKLGV
jgi:hypothetical protein